MDKSPFRFSKGWRVAGGVVAAGLVVALVGLVVLPGPANQALTDVGSAIRALRGQDGALQTRAGQLGQQAAATAPAGTVYGAHTMLPGTLDAAGQSALLDSAQSSGVSWVRVTFNWSSVQPQPGTTSFTRMDGVVQAANRRGLKVLATVMSTPDWASSDPTCPTSCSSKSGAYPPKVDADWQSFVSSLAGHYAEACKTDSSMCIGAYEIWNEPTLPSFFVGTPEKYAELLSVAFDAIHAADASAIVMNGGLTENAQDLNGAPIDPGVWLNRMMTNAAYPAANKLDRMAVHVRGTLAFAQSRTAFWRAEFSKYGTLAAKPLWITEHGYSSDAASQPDPLFKGTDAATAAAQQSQYLSASVPALVAAGAAAVFVTLPDNPALTTVSYQTEGVVRADMVSAKPAFAALRALATGTVAAPAAPSALLAQPDASTTARAQVTWTDGSVNETGFEVWRQDGSGAAALLATVPANTSSYSDSNLVGATSYTYTVRAINGGGSSAFSASSVVPALPAAPASVSVTKVLGTAVSLAWVDSATNEAGYIVERKSGTGDFTQVGTTLAVNVTVFTDATAVALTDYAYRVRAINARGSALSGNVVTSTPAPGFTRTEETAASITYMGAWTARAITGTSSGSVKTANAKTAQATFTFTGSGVSVVAAKTSQLGKVRITVDGVATDVDLYSATSKAQVAVFVKDGLANRAHTVLVAPTGTKNALSTGTMIALDAFDTH